MTAFKEYKLRSAIKFARESSDQMTPWQLALQMVDAIPSHLFNTQALVPGSGMGTFALALVYKGWDPSKIVCIELDAGFALYTKVRSPDINTIHTDYLTWEPNMQFDVVITNVPFQAPTPEGEERNIGRQLWPLFIEKSLQLVKPDGYISLITPATWLNRRSRSKAWKLVKGCNLVSCMPDVKWAFPNVGGNGGTFSVMSLTPGKYKGTTTIDGKFEVNAHTAILPTNNAAITPDNLEFLKTVKRLELDVHSGDNPFSINSDHYSDVKTDTHTYEVYYSGQKRRRSVWANEPVGHSGELKLIVANSGNVYDSMEITTKGAGRQTHYVLGDMETLLSIQQKLRHTDSQHYSDLMRDGNFVSPLEWIADV